MSYLNVLRQPCMDLYNVNSLNDIIDLVPELFTKFILILEESTYYNET